MAVTVPDILDMKRRGERFAMLTAYDYTTASLLAEAGIPILLVGDSVANTMLGYPTTLPVTMAEMLHHARAVARGAPGQLLVGDLPFNSYHASDEEAIRNAARMLQAGMHAVKLEGGGRIAGLVGTLTARGIPVMGHLGLTPQSLHLFGGFRVQGREAAAAERLEADAQALQESGAFAVVLEGIPRALAASITHRLEIPTIGIGAGPDCDGQVLTVTDMLGLTRGHVAKFVKAYAALGDEAIAAARRFAAEVASGAYPDDAHSYH